MWNEAERLAFNASVSCAHCGSKNVEVGGWTTTIASASRWEDENHNWHEHDSNRIDAYYDCKACGQRVKIHPLNSCWCGWSQGASITHEMLVKKAKELWIERGSPIGSPEVDWDEAKRQLYRGS